MGRKLILLLGEGNFSFARILAASLKSESQTCDDIDLIATDFVEKNDNDQHNEELDINMEQLSIDESIRENIRELNVPVWLDLDCTQMENHKRLESVLSSGKYTTLFIVFNYPHVKNVKMKINLNRDLLGQTFNSIQTLLKKHFQLKATVYISLCYGQSGLNEVEPVTRHRIWADSWQIQEMAAEGNFVLTNVTPFGVELIENLMGNTINFLASQFEHNLKQYNKMCSSKTPADEPELTEPKKSDSFYQSFGYKLQNRPFNKHKGGNVFQFELREDILLQLQSLNSELIHHRPVFQQLARSLKNLLHDEWPKLSIIPTTDTSMFPNVCYLHICNITSKNVHPVLNSIGKYLTSLNENTRYSIIDSFLFVDQVKCSTLKCDKIFLNMETTLATVWKLKDRRILYSNYVTEMKNPVEGQQSGKIISTGLLYPRVYNRDVSFWVIKNEDFRQSQVELLFDIELEFSKIAQKLFGTSLVSVKLKDKYIKSLLESSYCFTLQIQSLDLALNRKKIAEMLKQLQNEILECKLYSPILNIKLR